MTGKSSRPETRPMTKKEKREIFKVLEDKLFELGTFINKYIPPSWERREASRKIVAAGRMLEKTERQEWKTLADTPDLAEAPEPNEVPVGN